MKPLKRVIRNIYLAIVKMIEHDGVEHSGYMSFMMLVAIFPFFIFILALTSFFGASEIGRQFLGFAIENMPENSIEIIKIRVNEMLLAPPQSLLTLAILGTLWTASSFVECLRTILNRVYEIKSPPPYILRRLMSIAQFLLISLAIFLSVFLLIIVPIALAKIPNIVVLASNHAVIIQISRYILIFLSLFLTVCALYYIIPNAVLKFTEVIPGAILTVLLWAGSGYFLSKYIIYYNQLNLVYGSLGSIIVTLIFFYIVNMIFIIGAEFNHLSAMKESAEEDNNIL
jgi:membrane protein